MTTADDTKSRLKPIGYVTRIIACIVAFSPFPITLGPVFALCFSIPIGSWLPSCLPMLTAHISTCKLGNNTHVRGQVGASLGDTWLGIHFQGFRFNRSNEFIRTRCSPHHSGVSTHPPIGVGSFVEIIKSPPSPAQQSNHLRISCHCFISLPRTDHTHAFAFSSDPSFRRVTTRNGTVPTTFRSFPSQRTGTTSTPAPAPKAHV